MERPPTQRADVNEVITTSETSPSNLTFRSRGFKIPINVMLDLNALQKHVPVITVEEYLLLHDRNTSLEVGNGAWSTELYQEPDADIFRIENDWFEPSHATRVDRLPVFPDPIMPPANTSARRIYDHLANSCVEGALTSTQAIFAFLSLSVEMPELSIPDDEDVVEVMESYGFGLLHTYPTR